MGQTLQQLKKMPVSELIFMLFYVNICSASQNLTYTIHTAVFTGVTAFLIQHERSSILNNRRV